MVIASSIPTVDKEMEEALVKALNEEFFVGGPSVERFEEEFAEYVGAEHAVAVSSGTDALVIALRCLGIENRVITSPMTFVATAESIVLAGAAPRFADIDESWNLDPLQVEAQIDEDVEAIMPVHLYGLPCDMDYVMDIAEDNDLLVVEDAAQSHGATVVDGTKVGAIGDIGCFSFYSTKNMTVGGNGGMITTNDEDVAEMAALLREHGGGNHSKYVGYNARLNTINAAFGLVQLQRLDGWIQRRRQIADIYARRLHDVDDIRLPVDADGHVYHLYVVQARERDALKARLREDKIFCGIHYPEPVHQLEPYRRYAHHGYPHAERHAEMALSLPMYPTLENEDVEMVCDIIQEFYGA